MHICVMYDKHNDNIEHNSKIKKLKYNSLSMQLLIKILNIVIRKILEKKISLTTEMMSDS